MLSVMERQNKCESHLQSLCKTWLCAKGCCPLELDPKSDSLVRLTGLFLILTVLFIFRNLSLKKNFNILQQNYTSEQWASAAIWGSWDPLKTALNSLVQSGLVLVFILSSLTFLLSFEEVSLNLKCLLTRAGKVLVHQVSFLDSVKTCMAEIR